MPSSVFKEFQTLDWRVAEIEKRLRLEEQRAATGVQGVSLRNTATQADLDALEIVVAGLGSPDFTTFYQESAAPPATVGSVDYRFHYDSSSGLLYTWSVDDSEWRYVSTTAYVMP